MMKKSMLKEKSAVQISIEGHSEKRLEVPTFVVKYWKQLSFSVLAIIALLIGSLTYIAKQKTTEDISSKYEATLDKVKEQNRALNINKLQAEQDVKEAKKSFDKIDSTLESINNKMKQRGLKEISLENVGGPIEKDPENIELLTAFYEDALKDLDKKLSSLPIGKPHDGAVTSRFGYRANPFTHRGREMHSGVDLRGNIGQPIKVTANGKVTYAGYEGEYGNVVKVKHANGYETRYAHLVRVLVKPGDNVEAGKLVGLLGNTGRSTGPHLHYEILKNGTKIDPEKYFSF